MNFFADEGVDRAVVEGLRLDGHNVEYVAEMAPGIGDGEVLRRANDRGAVLITADKDFGELVFRQGQAHAGILLLRIGVLTKAEKVEAVAEVVRDHGAALVGAFSVLTPDSVRIRPGGAKPTP
jgi:predicted nuclease of predicted toxin-antitoxin system